MKDNKNKKFSFLFDDNEQDTATDALNRRAGSRTERLKKPIILSLMAIVFLGCLYFIFNPSSDKKGIGDLGLNDSLPQATGAGLQGDKRKAYEQATLEQKQQEQRKALLSLSDYWSADSSSSAAQADTVYPESGGNVDDSGKNDNTALSSYQNAQTALTSFYDNTDYEAKELRRQIDELKEQLAEKNEPQTTGVQDQLALMEKSYEMASRYLPSNMPQPGKDSAGVPSKLASQKDYFVAFTPARKKAVSSLYREPTDGAFLDSWENMQYRSFRTACVSERIAQPKNSIRAVVQETQAITDESGVRLRLLETAQTPNFTIPIGTVLTANAKFNNGRLQLKVTSIEQDGNIIPVDITVYDLDGQQGLYVPYSPEINALTEIASNMSQTSGTSIMMTRSAGQQAAGDLSRGVVQGVSGYLSKKMRTPKVTIKAGHQLLLVSKK